MPTKQAQLEFPIRKSLRRKQKVDKENVHPCLSKENNAKVANTKLESTPSHSSPLKRVVTPTKRSARIAEAEGLSPQKRPTENLRQNLSVTPFSPSKQVNQKTLTDLPAPSVRKQILKSFPQHTSPRKHCPENASVQDALLPCRRSPRKTPRKDSHNALSSPVRTPTVPSKLSEARRELFNQAKLALNTQQPDEVVCREEEMQAISTFINKHVRKSKAGSLYISGAPGTGKTAVIKYLLQQMDQDNVQKIFINSMTVKSPYAMYRLIATELLGPKATLPKTAKDMCTLLRDSLTSPGKTVVLVLDEMDQLDSRQQEALYTVFEWPSLSRSRLVLIGIANALDLTDRILPRLNVRSRCKPELLHFAPYTKDEIVSVIESRLQQTPEIASQVLDKSAMVFCARKVSAVAGDMRKALDICRRSVELSQVEEKKQAIIERKAGGRSCTPLSTPNTSRIGITQVAQVVDEVYGSASSSARPNTFPLQQKLIACTLLLMLKSSKLKEVNLGKVHDTYCKVCRKRDVSPTDQSEFISLCQLLETRGILCIKKAKEARMMKLSLKMDERELEFALKDKLLISSVLEDGL